LAGGKSSRFKRGNKLISPFLGELLIEGAVKAARQVADEVLVVGKGLPPKEFKGARWASEAFTGHSPLYGVLTALKEAKGEKVLTLPGDCPLIRPEVLKLLAQKEPPAFIEGNYLFALLRKGDFLTVEEMLREGEHKVRELHRRLKSRKVKLKEVLPLDYRVESFKNLNYYEDYTSLFTGEER
jgi:molybdopterin-guanine dinucleotide biosynthesis protein A